MTREKKKECTERAGRTMVDEMQMRGKLLSGRILAQSTKYGWVYEQTNSE
jgi:hypothetical protein